MTDNLCDCCDTLEVYSRDYRPDEMGNVNKIYVCKVCIGLNNESFHEIMHADSKERKAYLLREATDEEFWEELGIPEPPDEDNIEVISWELKLHWNDGCYTSEKIPDKLIKSIEKYIKKKHPVAEKLESVNKNG